MNIYLNNHIIQEKDDKDLIKLILLRLYTEIINKK
jgi:hypothetical protein